MEDFPARMSNGTIFNAKNKGEIFSAQFQIGINRDLWYKVKQPREFGWGANVSIQEYFSTRVSNEANIRHKVMPEMLHNISLECHMIPFSSPINHKAHPVLAVDLKWLDRHIVEHMLSEIVRHV